MADDQPKVTDKAPAALSTAETGEHAEEHYEIVSEYRIGEGAPPLWLIVAFVFIVIWASISWIPFFGY